MYPETLEQKIRAKGPQDYLGPPDLSVLIRAVPKRMFENKHRWQHQDSLAVKAVTCFSPTTYVSISPAGFAKSRQSGKKNTDVIVVSARRWHVSCPSPFGKVRHPTPGAVVNDATPPMRVVTSGEDQSDLHFH